MSGEGERARQGRRQRTSRFQSPYRHPLFCLLSLLYALPEVKCLCSEDQRLQFQQLQCSLTFSGISHQQLSPLPPASYWIIPIDIIISCYFSRWNTKQQQRTSPLSPSHFFALFHSKTWVHVHNLISCHCLIEPLKSECCFPHFTEATLAKAHSGSTGQSWILIWSDLPTSDAGTTCSSMKYLLYLAPRTWWRWKKRVESWVKTQHSKN